MVVWVDQAADQAVDCRKKIQQRNLAVLEEQDEWCMRAALQKKTNTVTFIVHGNN